MRSKSFPYFCINKVYEPHEKVCERRILVDE